MGLGEAFEPKDADRGEPSGPSAVEATGSSRHQRPESSGALTHDEARHEEHPIHAPLDKADQGASTVLPSSSRTAKPGNAAADLEFRVRAVEPSADRGSGEIRSLLARLLVRRYLEKHTDASKRVAA